MEYDTLLISGHAFRRMFERDIADDDVVEVIRKGEIIESYPDDTPYPSFLMLGRASQGPLHVVVAKDQDKNVCHLITAYLPDPAIWNTDFKTRRKP